MGLEGLDVALFRAINVGFHYEVLDALMIVLSTRTAYIAVPLFLAVIVRQRKDAFAIAVVTVSAVALSDWFGFGLKELLMRPRPFNALEDVTLLVGRGGSHSMPSNHAANLFALAVSVSIMTRDRLRYSLLVLAVLVALSRVYVGVHYPSDVLVGAALGACMAGSVASFYAAAKARSESRPWSTWLIVVLTVISIFRVYYIIHAPVDLSPDEAFYWEYSRHLDLSYYEKGPLIAWLIWLGTWAFGHNELGVRALAVVISVLASLVVYQLGREMHDERTGAVSAVLLQVIPLFNAQGVIMTIDAPLMLLWALSLWMMHRAVRTGQLAYWLLLGISTGLGMLAKYSMAFFYLSAFLYLVTSKELRHHLRRPAPYAGLLLSLAVFSPVIVWNARNGWVTLKHTAGHANVAGGLGLSASSFFNFLGSQLGVITPVLLVMMVMALVKARRTDEGRFHLWFSAPMLVFFLLKSLQGKVQANWAMPGYITALVAFCAVYLRDLGSLNVHLKRSAVIAVIVAVAVTAVSYYPSAFGVPVRLDPTEKIRGWSSLGKEASRVSQSLGWPHFIITDRYQVAAELAFYMEDNPTVYCMNFGRRMNQYDLWPKPEAMEGYDALFVKMMNLKKPPKQLEKAFDRCEKRLFTVREAGQKLRDYTIFVCRGFRGEIQEVEPTKF